MTTQKNAIVGQSGGPTAAINASLAGVIKEACASNEIGTIYGMRNGISGLIEERFVDLNELGADEAKLSLLSKTPASYLGSCRFKLPAEDGPVYDKIFDILEKYNIQYFFYIGGNDSMDTIMKLSAFSAKRGKDIRFVGVPKTIDNDLQGIDHTPGYGSAAKYIAATVREISADVNVYDVEAVTIVEIMGRDAGWLAGASALARYQGLGPDLIYLPENVFDLDAFVEDVKTVMQKKKNILVAVSEGVRVADGTYVCEMLSVDETDAFGHKKMGGVAAVLATYVKQKLGCKSRGIELSVCQRCAGHILSKTDITESFGVGASAVRLALKGETGVMATILRCNDAPYGVEFASVDVTTVANKEKVVPEDFIAPNKHDVTDAFVAYVTPLISGEITPEYENGVPKQLVLNKEI